MTPLLAVSLAILVVLGALELRRRRRPDNAPADSCEVSDVRATLLADSHDRQSNTWTIQLTWSPPVGSCQQYVGYSVEVYYESQGKWLGYNWVPSLEATDIRPALFPNEVQKYRVRPQTSPQSEIAEVGPWAESNSLGPQASPPAEQGSANKPSTPKKSTPKAPSPKAKKKAQRPRNIVIAKRQEKKKPRGRG